MLTCVNSCIGYFGCERDLIFELMQGKSLVVQTLIVGGIDITASEHNY
jgi:hypothetical protein